MRTINAPDAQLKRIQKRILKLLRYIERPDWLISGERGKSYVDNGQFHVDCNYMMTADIKSFYDNCRREPVYQFFIKKMKAAPDVAKALADIITYNGGIPTGCPTSQLLAYYAYEEMFKEVAHAAEDMNCRFSLYVDDMTFSSQTAFDPKVLSRRVDCILRCYGHHLKAKKVHYYPRNSDKSVTGTVITKDHKLAVPNKLRKNICDDFHVINNLSGSNNTVNQTTQLAQLIGRVNAAQAIQPSVFPEVSRLTNRKRKNMIIESSQ